MPGDDHAGAAVLLEAAHRSQPCLQPAVVALDAVVGVAVGAMPGRWQPLLQHGRIHRRLISCDLDRTDHGRANRPLEEPVGGRGVSLPGDEDVDDLPELVNRPVYIPPLPGDLHVGLVHLPAVADGVPTRPGGVDSSGVNRWTHR
jgi:hypothetical protein